MEEIKDGMEEEGVLPVMTDTALEETTGGSSSSSLSLVRSITIGSDSVPSPTKKSPYLKSYLPT